MIPLQSPFKLQKTLFGAHGVSILVLHMDFSIHSNVFTENCLCLNLGSNTCSLCWPLTLKCAIRLIQTRSNPLWTTTRHFFRDINIPYSAEMYWSAAVHIRKRSYFEWTFRPRGYAATIKLRCVLSLFEVKLNNWFLDRYKISKLVSKYFFTLADVMDSSSSNSSCPPAKRFCSQWTQTVCTRL